MKLLRFYAAVALIALAATQGTAQDFDKGLAAYQAGDYQTAFKEWAPLFEEDFILAQYKLGLINDCFGALQDKAEAVSEALRLYRLAADQGHAVAQSNLGSMYDQGLGVPQDDAEAVKWYRLAADQGFAAAQAGLGLHIWNGEGLKQDDIKGLMWLIVADANGLAIQEDIVSISTTMSQDAIATAHALASMCMNSGYKNCGD